MKTINILLALIGLQSISVYAVDKLNINVLQNSIHINGTEIRTGSKIGERRFISLKAVEQVLGQPEKIRLARVTAYVWKNDGINVQRGFRGDEKDKVFKLQVFLTDFFNKRDGIQSGTFTGQINLDGVFIKADSTLDSMRDKLKEAGFSIMENSNPKMAKNGNITIFTDDSNSKFERFEAWCPLRLTNHRSEHH